MNTYRLNPLRVVLLLCLILTGLFTGCQKDTLDPAVSDPEISIEPETDAESETSVAEKEFFEGPTTDDGELVTIQWRGQKLQVLKVGGEYLIGDMRFNPDDISGENPKTASNGRTDRLWPDNTVYYTVNSGLPNKSRITDGIADWESKTNLRFVERTNQSAYIEFRKSDVCNSSVGRTGSRQVINLADNCGVGAVIHEIGHAIGFLHEQSRSDRDDYVKINLSNIPERSRFNFFKWNAGASDLANFTNRLDFNSIMMYGPYAFAIDRSIPTITRLNGDTYPVQRRELSAGDVQGANTLYPAITSGGIESGAVYRITSKASGKVMDITGASRNSGARLQQWPWKNGNNQKFRVQNAGGGSYRLTAVHSGKVLDVVDGSTANSAEIQQWDYAGNNNQKWNLVSKGGGEYEIVSVNSGKLIDVPRGTDENINLIQWPRNNGDNQRWIFQKQ
ncbi:MAG: M12 family metallopeptidase [Pricia sp.]